jgi:FkbM family methyltransferase
VPDIAQAKSLATKNNLYMHIINKILGEFGIRMVRTSRNRVPGDVPAFATPLPMRVGRFDIWCPPESPLHEEYRLRPHYISELGRIAAVVYSKYPEMIVVDVGANVGDTAAIVRTACPAPIVCIEGDPRILGALAENAKIIGDIDILNLYLDEECSTRRMSVTKAGWNSTLVDEDRMSPGEVIQFVTLDEGLKDLDLRRVRLLKVDTEGFDGRVLRGARGILSGSRPVVLFEYNRENMNAIGEDGNKIFSYLKEHGYYSLLFWDNSSRFMLGAKINDSDLISDLHDYVNYTDGKLGCVYYLDVCAFHREDEDLAETVLAGERRVRAESGKSEP